MEFMNVHTRKSIDVEYIFDMIDPKTPYGIQNKKEMKPYARGEEKKLEDELDKTEMIMEIMKDHEGDFNEIDYILGDIREIRASLKRAQNGMVLDEVELFEIKNFIFNIGEFCRIQDRLGAVPEDMRLYRSPALEKLLDPENLENRTFYIYDSYSEKLRDIRREKNELLRKYEGERKKVFSYVSEALGIVPKLSGEITVQKKNEKALKASRECPCLIEESSTLLSVTFRIKMDDEAESLHEQIEALRLSEEREEYNIRKNISSRLMEKAGEIHDLTARTGGIDLLIAKARFAMAVGGVKPSLHNEAAIIVKGARHIRLDEILAKQNRHFTPVTCTLNNGVTVITGANMGGKTVRLKLVGMLQAMVQYGLFVPAEEYKTFLFDYIYFSIGDMQSIDTGLSTFGSEIAAMLGILKQSEYRGLILIDELARGTNPNEGYAISRAIVRYLKSKSSITLFTTHYSGITRERGVEHLRIRGLKKVDFDELKKRLDEGRGMELLLNEMDYSLEKVEDCHDVPMDAINIARLMGLDEKILCWAEEIINSGSEE